MRPIYRNSAYIFLALLLAFGAFPHRISDLVVPKNAAPLQQEEEYVRIETASLSFVGDIMLDRGVKGKVNRFGAGDFNFLFEDAAFLKEADLMFGNLEGPVSSRGANVGSIYSFRFDPVVFPVLKEAGFDVLSIANNHIGDWGKLAIEDTLTLGNESGLGMVGGGFGYQEAMQPKIYEVKGIKVGYLAFSDFGPASIILNEKSATSSVGVLSADDPYLPFIVSDAARAVDILVVSFHFGDEYMPLSNDRQKRLARSAVDAGADIVAGHHPHVEQEVEEYRSAIIAYSLGNFIFDQDFSKATMQGMKLDVTVSKEGIMAYGTTTVVMNANYQPSVIE